MSNPNEEAPKIAIPDAVATNQNELAKELVTFPADFIFYNKILNKCWTSYQKAKLDLATLEARLFASYREKLSGQKEASVTSIRAAVEADPEYFTHRQNELERESSLKLAQTMVDAMEHKASMLEILGSLFHG